MEAELVHSLIERYSPGATTLLDVACGTGKHLEQLRTWYDVQGLDLDEQLIAIARERLGGVSLHLADMTSFALDRRFDVVTCLFSSIGYVGTVERLNNAVAAMSAHLNSGGVLIVEPWLSPRAVGGLSPTPSERRSARRQDRADDGVRARRAACDHGLLVPGRDIRRNRALFGAPRSSAFHRRGVSGGFQEDGISGRPRSSRLDRARFVRGPALLDWSPRSHSQSRRCSAYGELTCPVYHRRRESAGRPVARARFELCPGA